MNQNKINQAIDQSIAQKQQEIAAIDTEIQNHESILAGLDRSMAGLLDAYKQLLQADKVGTDDKQ